MDSEIRLTAYSSDVAISALQKQCGICKEAAGKYTCPRCNVSYCSLGCFKHQTHSGCSESFYKDCFVQEMKQSRASDAEKLRIMKMLKNFEDENKKDDDPTEILEERLKNVNLDDSDEVWSRLTPDEREEFKRNMQNGSLVKEWSPWWLYHDTNLVTEIDSVKQNTKDRSPVPQYNLQVKSIEDLLQGSNPSILVGNNLVNVLFCYAYFCRRYNGNMNEIPCEFAHDIISASTFLSKGITLQSCSESVQSAMDGCTTVQRELNSTEREGVETILDTYHILLGSHKDDPSNYSIAGISELHTTCKSLKRSIKKKEFCSNIDSKDIFKIMKKIEFLLAWITDYNVRFLPLALEVFGIYKDRLKFHKEHESHKEATNKSRSLAREPKKKKVIIEEIR
uniref:zinc finger HIT domain-containing protein 2-like n=1 Tax=Styela clava TaxID=7725 RepID=UPI0019399C85|nr:zinc finger HIT domain-containing protein 2-like [Styela clava]